MTACDVDGIVDSDMNMSGKTDQQKPDGTALIQLDPWLEPHADALRARYARYREFRERIDQSGGLMGDVSKGHSWYGFNCGEKEGVSGVWYREWAPGATYVSLIGDFNEWDRGANPLERNEWGVWSTFLPDGRLTQGDRIKVHVASGDKAMDRLPAYVRRVVQEKDTTHFVGQHWPEEEFSWDHESPKLTGAPRVYEAHVGIAPEEGRIGTFEEFTSNVLPRIVDLGYNVIQLMAIQEHPYYASFGYLVSNYFAPSSRFGTPEQLKKLIDTAHGMGLSVIMDIVHSHSVKNVHEGLNQFDGTDHQYFHAGARGEHPAWGSMCFDYSKYEVQRFLLSNIRYWLEEFRFDGFRFDGVTSMMYLDHGLNRVFTTYDEYFGDGVDLDSIAYLMLANDLVHEINPDAITIAEDVSGMPGTARPVCDGGLGFDFRLSMGIADYWIKTLKENEDEQWDLGNLYHTMTDRRPHEKHIGYVESHDQAIVGDKTIAFRLMDAKQYSHMSVTDQDIDIDRGIALHKMIRLITFTLGGEGYLNFMGNEFGHPEWIDFPREGNDNSFHHARRQWSLVESDQLRYKGLNAFDRAMVNIDIEFGLLSDPFIEQLAHHEDARQLIYRRGPLVFVFNFHATQSYTDWRIPVPDQTDYAMILNTDNKAFEGHGAVDESTLFVWQDVPACGRDQSIQIYSPARSAQVFAPKSAGTS